MFDHHLTSEGLLLRRDAIRLGITDKSLGRATRSGQLVRIRQGAYVRAEVWHAADRGARHLLMTTGVLSQYDDRVALSHCSAALVYGAPDWGLDLDDVDVTHLGGSGRREAKVAHHHGWCGVNDLTRVGGRWITTPARTVVDACGQVSVEAGAVLASDFLRRGLTTMAELEHFRTRAEGNPRSLSMRTVLALADRRFESVGEVRSRYLFWTEQLPPPEIQFEVFQPSGLLAGRVDFAWPEYGVLLEFDGRAKYLEHRRPGESVADAVLREKRREDLLRELTGWIVIRLTWADLYRPAETAARIRAAFARATA